MIQDLHAHTYYSYCGKDSPEAVIRSAISGGVELLGISDHYYGVVMNHPGVTYASAAEKRKHHTNLLQRYYEHIQLLAQKYKNDITVWCGLELATVDLGYTLLPEGVDVSYFDYCLIEDYEKDASTVEDLFAFAARCGCGKIGLAHSDLPAYIHKKGQDIDAFLGKLAAYGIFWELNVNYDSIHGYREHDYVKAFFENKDGILDAVRKSGLKVSVGFDGHRVAEYDVRRVKDACAQLEKSGVSIFG